MSKERSDNFVARPVCPFMFIFFAAHELRTGRRPYIEGSVFLGGATCGSPEPDPSLGMCSGHDFEATVETGATCTSRCVILRSIVEVEF